MLVVMFRAHVPPRAEGCSPVILGSPVAEVAVRQRVNFRFSMFAVHRFVTEYSSAKSAYKPHAQGLSISHVYNVHGEKRMPKYIEQIRAGAETYYAVFSTVVMDYLTPFYDSVEQLREEHPEYSGLQLAEETVQARRVGNALAIIRQVYQINVGE